MFLLIKTSLFVFSGYMEQQAELLAKEADKSVLVSRLSEVMDEMVESTISEPCGVVINNHYLDEIVELNEDEKRTVIGDALVVSIIHPPEEPADEIMYFYSIVEV